MTDLLWACRSSLKIATGISPSSLVYGTEVINPMELVIPTPRVVLEENQEGADGTNNERRLSDLERLKEEQEVTRRRSQRYQQRMAKAYARQYTRKPSRKGRWC